MTKIRLAPESLRKLLDCGSYRAFLGLWIEERSKVRRFGFSDIARAARFASRSFPRDVQLGTKRITLRSREKFIQGMGLTGDLASYFRILVDLEEPSCRPIGTDEKKLERSRKALRKRLLEKAGFAEEKVQMDDSIFVDDFPRIYAALGSEDRGASLPEITGRTGVSSSRLSKALASFVQKGWVREEGGRYHPHAPHVNLEGLDGSFPFERRFARVCAKAAHVSDQRRESAETLFFTSAFSVRAVDLPALKEELRSMLLQYVERNEASEGERVVEVLAALL
jgi:hypothetical protein